MQKETMLIVDDVEVNRASLNALFSDRYIIYEAGNGADAIATIKSLSYNVDVILLDLMMPVMNGFDVLKAMKSNAASADIPVVVITASDADDDQVKAFRNGANDFITKPFVPEIVCHRVNNTSVSNRRMIQIMKEREMLIQKARLDLLTSCYNRITFEELVDEKLAEYPSKQHALLVFDIDNFKKVNDEKGHLAGDHTLKIVADLLSSHFRYTDFVGRIGGDEFAAFMFDIPTEEIAINKTDDIMRILNFSPNLTFPANVSVSVGISFSEGKRIKYNTMFEMADKAMYCAKQSGKDTYRIYGVN